jgi:predicted metal-dependent phosphotriesterase family hydrolase
VISPDLGQYVNPLHTDGMRAFILGLRGQGISDAEIDLMARKNPARMLGLKD